MLKRILEENLQKSLDAMPVVALQGPRQVGKTTLALEVAKGIDKPGEIAANLFA